MSQDNNDNGTLIPSSNPTTPTGQELPGHAATTRAIDSQGDENVPVEGGETDHVRGGTPDHLIYPVNPDQNPFPDAP